MSSPGKRREMDVMKLMMSYDVEPVATQSSVLRVTGPAGSGQHQRVHR